MTIKEHLKNYREYRDFVRRYDRGTLDSLDLDLDPAALRAARDIFARKAALIENAVASLQDPTEQTLIRLRYLEGHSWTKIGFIMYYSKSSLQRIHVQALNHLEQSGVVIE